MAAWQRARTAFMNSTLAQAAWERARHAARRWGLWGAALGLLAGLLLFAPAAWLAAGVAQASGQRLLLAQAEGSLWDGSALLVLTGGADSRDAALLPQRLHWRLRPGLGGLQLTLRQAGHIDGDWQLTIRPGLGRVVVSTPPRPGPVGHWPASWLAGLGTPWNTLQLGGQLQLDSRGGFELEQVQGRWRLAGGAELQLLQASSRLSTLDTLGSYRLTLQGGSTTQLLLATSDGALQLSGSGQWGAGPLRFRGEARAAGGQEAALANLLNIIARRQGGQHLISIG